MVLKIGQYRRSKYQLIGIYKEKGVSRACEMAVSSGVNLIAFYSFLNEEFPCKEFEDKIKSLCEFYKIDEVIE